MKVNQKIMPINGMNLSIDESIMPSELARFIKGWELFVNENNSSDQNSSSQEGSNQYTFTKNESNTLFTQGIPLHTGVGTKKAVNKSIRGGFVPETGKYYSCIWNDNNQHSIWELDYVNRKASLVIQSSCLDFKYEPEHFINNSTRFAYTVNTIYDKKGNVSFRTWIIITDNNSRTKQIQVEDAIATNGFVHTFFSDSQNCCSICDLITLGYPGRPRGCIGITPIIRPDTPEEKSKTNKIINNVFQFRLKHIDVWSRESIHGDISESIFISKTTSCTEDESLLPRCLELEFDGGCKTIATIIVEYRICGAGNAANLESDWKEHIRIDKYSDCDGTGKYIPNFWERSFNPTNTGGDITYIQTTNRYKVLFCGGKLCISIPKSETDIVVNNIPNKSMGVFNLGNKIALANNEYEFDPNTCNECESVKYTLESETSCDPFIYRKIEIWIVIYSVLDNEITNIRTFEASNSASTRAIGYGRAGKTNGDWSSTKDNPGYYNQVFNGTNGFVVYANGHNEFAITEQYDISSGTPIKVGVMQKKSNGLNLQKAELFLPAGKYIFSVADPMAGVTETINGVNGGTPGIKFRESSADLIGITSLSNIGNVVNEQYELIVDTTTGDFTNYSTPLMIWDLTRDVKSTLVPNNPQVVKGYVHDINWALNGKLGIEMIDVNNNNGSTTIHKSSKTDRNGHYFATMKGTALSGGDLELTLGIVCPSIILPSFVLGTATPSDEFTTQINNSGFIETREIKGKIIECNNNTPAIGMVLVMQNGGIGKTNQNGEYSIKYHGYNGNRSGHEILVHTGQCLWTLCNNPCSNNFPNILPAFKPCNDPSYITIPVIEVAKVESLVNRSIAQGNYSIGIVLEDCLAQTYVRCENTVEIKDTDDINRITFDLTGVNFGQKYNYLSFYITENLSYSKWLEWIIDYVILEDNNGNISYGNTQIVNPARMRIYLNSLIHYSALTQANTGWEFLKDDIINFRKLADGTKINITRLISYQPGDSYITVEYDEATMQQISEGTKIRILRPRNCTNENEFYYQLCGGIKIVNGAPTTLTGTINFTNSFKVTRSVPRYENIVEKKDSIQNKYDTNGKVIDSEIKNIPVSTPTSTGQYKTLIFNHHSPSDFYGNMCWGRGRVNTVNKHEGKHRRKTEVALGGAIGFDGKVNFQHWFETSGAIVFDEQSFDSITGVVPGQNIILVICENNVFTSLYDQQEVTFDNKTGQMYATPAEKRFSKPRTKVGGEYGCLPVDLNTIQHNNGSVIYLNSKSAMIVKHNFDSPIDFTPDGIKGWLKEKIHYYSQYNLTTIGKIQEYKKAFISAVDMRQNQYILTGHQLMSGIIDYTNNEINEYIEKNETIGIDWDNTNKLTRAFYHWTPEMIDFAYTPEMGQQLTTWMNGIPYIHNEVRDNNIPNTDEHLLFYGQKCKPILTLIFNINHDINKNWLNITALIKQHKLYAYRVITNQNQISWIMPRSWIKTNSNFTAPFMTQTNAMPDVNKPNQTGNNSIEDGITLHGNWVKVILVTEDENDTKYAEFNGAIVSAQIEDKI